MSCFSYPKYVLLNYLDQHWVLTLIYIYNKFYCIFMFFIDDVFPVFQVRI